MRILSCPIIVWSMFVYGVQMLDSSNSIRPLSNHGRTLIEKLFYWNYWISVF